MLISCSVQLEALIISFCCRMFFYGSLVCRILTHGVTFISAWNLFTSQLIAKCTIWMNDDHRFCIYKFIPFCVSYRSLNPVTLRIHSFIMAGIFWLYYRRNLWPYTWIVCWIYLMLQEPLEVLWRFPFLLSFTVQSFEHTVSDGGFLTYTSGVYC